MTEEIIIDGVDVAGCCCFENDKCLWSKKYYENPYTPDCKLVDECYYKQLKRLEQENKELSFAIEKCLENAGIECDDEEQALRSLPMLGNAHHKVLVEKEELEQENKELKSDVLKWQKAFSRQYQINENKGYSKAEENYRSALEEIRENLVKLKTNDEDDFTYEYSKIEDKINKILN